MKTTMAWGMLAVLVLPVANCGGVSIEEPSEAGAGGDGASGPFGAGGDYAGGVGGVGVGGVGGVGGKGVAGRPGKGGAPGIGGTQGLEGGRSGAGAGGGRAGYAGGAIFEGGRAGSGGSLGGQAGEDDGAAGQSCGFEQIPVGRRCSTAGSRVQDDYSTKLLGGTRAECQEACLAHPSCTAVVDYLAGERLDACYIRHAACGTPGPQNWAEEDAGKEYRKVCEGGDCRLEYLGNFIRCPDDDDIPVVNALGTADCEQACLDDPDCTSMTQYFWLAEIIGCHIFSGDCDEFGTLPYGDPGLTYRKVCE